MDIYLDDVAPDELEEQGGLVIEGQQARAPRTVFVDSLPDDFEKRCKDILAFTKCFDWNKVITWKKHQETFECSDQELAVIVTAEGCLNQIKEHNLKVITKFKNQNKNWQTQKILKDLSELNRT